MKYSLFAAVAAGVVLFSAACIPAFGAQPLDDIVAVAGERIIMQSELDDAEKRLRDRLDPQARGQMPPEDIVRSRVLDQLIITSLQAERAERAGMRVADKELNDAINNLAEQNGMDVAQFIQRLKAEGISVGQMRARMREQLLIEQLRKREVVDRVGVSDEDVDHYLESQSLRIRDDREYHIRHILIGLSEGASAASVRSAQERIKSIRERAENGESFGELAKSNSVGQKATEGGDLGWLPGGYMPTLLSDVVPHLQPGDISEVFRGPSGFHLIKLEGTRSAGGEDTSGPVMVQEVKAEHILLKPNEIRDQEQTKETISHLHDRLLAGDDFAELARTDSDDSSTATQGGDLGWIEPRRYPPNFARQLQQLKAGELSEPFETEDGWHLVKVLERRERDKSEEQQRLRARQAIGQRKLEEETAIWLRRLRDEAYVEVRMPDYQGENPDSKS